MITKAKYQKEMGNGAIKCELCPHGCNLLEGKTGICRTRGVKGNELVVYNYGEVAAINLDPIEKKPLYNYKPGSKILSIGSYGCNFRCGFCQNSDISMELPETRYMPALDVVEIAKEYRAKGNIGIAFTYNEPSTWFEYMCDTAKLAKKNDLDVILVTNGFINPEPLSELLDYVDAMNIDLKAFNEEFYIKHCGGNIEDVKRTIEIANEKCHVEITTLLVNGYNDSEEEIGKLSKYIASVNKDIPLHLTKYFPMYKFTAPETPKETVLKATKVAREYLNYVYPGNLFEEDVSTNCPECGELLIKRNDQIKVFVKSSKCPNCGHNINVVT